ncbi:pantetheine-phosphate adenylyltransferase [Helicobacter didelphidarum]|uniref:Phosphopantetheine adenylyltransferase n=1 Tax=Helicobacter didelphidarum TaxID=2040648 RepID=A0A3D8IGB3_9HELI|nr:pantetheine-phosphate adenylyltransferase [Helicobacter didelphidarum]RDU64232.1 pantetheine-phosphate adenylyltransferase [Helicobacter didelphidarum]
MTKLAIYPGTFDPLTNGHLDIIRRSSAMFQKVIIAVASSEIKNPLYSLKEREEMIKITLDEYRKELPNVECLTFNNLLATFAEELDAKVIIRGLRVVSDFEYELQMGYANASLNNSLETIYFMPTLQNAFISSSIVRSIITHNGRFNHLVPKGIHEYILRYKK